MKQYVAVVAWDEQGRVTKFMDFDDFFAAVRHRNSNDQTYPQMFVAENPGGDFETWRVVDGDLVNDAAAVSAKVEVARKDGIKRQIAALEATVTQRRIREATLGTDNGWLANIDSQIAALRAQL